MMFGINVLLKIYRTIDGENQCYSIFCLIVEVLVSFVLMLIMGVVWSAVAFRQLSPNLLTNPTDPNTIAEQNQYKFTQIHDRKLNAAIGNDNL